MNTAKPTRIQDIQTRILPDGYVVLFADETSWAFTLSPLGALVWEFCDGEHTLAQIADEIKRESPGDHEDLSESVSQLVNELSESGLLVLD